MNKLISDIIEIEPIPIYSISPEDHLMDAIKVMSQNNISCLIVIKDEEYVGIMTERDITNCCASCDDVYSSIVNDAMTRKIHFVTPEDTLEHATLVMREKGFRHLPVFKGKTIINVLSIRNLAFAKLDELQSDVDTLTDHVFTWEFDGKSHHFYKDIISARKSPH